MSTPVLVTQHHRGIAGRARSIISSMPGHVVGLLLVSIIAGSVVGWTSHSQGSPASSDTRTLLNQGYSALESALRTDSTNTYAEAAASFETVLSTSKDNPEALRGSAIADLGLHRFSLAHERASQAVQLRPGDYIALAALVDANIELGFYEEAETALARLLSIRPGLQAYTRLSYFRQLTGDSDGSLEAMYSAKSAAQGLVPETAKIDVLLGDLHFDMNNLESAQSHYRQALVLNSNRLDAATGLARIDWINGDQAGALGQANSILNTDPEHTGALMLLTEIHRRLGHTTQANETAEIVAQAVFAEHQAGYGIDPSAAVFLSSWGDPQQGLELAEIVFASRPSNVKAADAYAWGLHQMGLTVEATDYVGVATRFGVTSHSLQTRVDEILLGNP